MFIIMHRGMKYFLLCLEKINTKTVFDLLENFFLLRCIPPETVIYLVGNMDDGIILFMINIIQYVKLY